MSTPFRTLRVTPEGLVQLLQGITAGEVRANGPGISSGVGIGQVRYDEDARVLEIDLVDQGWADDGPHVGFPWARRYTQLGNASDWGAILEIGPPDDA